MVISFREYDSNAEQEIARFLDKNLYSKEIIKDFKRFSDKEDQLKGKDVQFSIEDLKDIIVDEKAQIYYVNKNIPTFAFEVNFIRNSGDLTLGWFFDSNKETQYYLLIWITADKERDFTQDDITQLECFLVSREKIIIFLAVRGVDKDKAIKIAKEIRESGINGRHKEGIFDGFNFNFSGHLAEKPINIVIRKEELKKLSNKHFIVIPIKP